MGPINFDFAGLIRALLIGGVIIGLVIASIVWGIVALLT